MDFYKTIGDEYDIPRAEAKLHLFTFMYGFDPDPGTGDLFADARKYMESLGFKKVGNCGERKKADGNSRY